MAKVTGDMDDAHAASLGRRYLIRFEEDTLQERPLWIRLIIEFVGTFVLVTVAAGSGVINHYVGGGPISRTAAVIAPGRGGHGHDLRLGPAVRAAHQPGGDLRLHRPRGVPAEWVLPYWVAQLAGAICAALFLQLMFGRRERGRELPDRHARR